MRQPIEDAMRDKAWASTDSVASNEVTIRPGLRGNWNMAVTTYPDLVEEILNELAVP
jgi:hypothetical protein